MAHLITCPECDKALQVPEDLIGHKVQCPECRHTFIASLPGSEPPSNAGTPKATSKPPAWDSKKTDAGSSKKTRRRDDDDDEDRDDDRRRRRDDDEDDDDLDIDNRRSRRGRSRRGSGGEVPGKVTTIGVMALVGGIIAVIMALTVGASTCCIWPGAYYGLVVGILAIVKGSALLSSGAREIPPPTTIGILMIINIINLDVVCMVLGIVILVFCNDEEVINYMGRG